MKKLLAFAFLAFALMISLAGPNAASAAIFIGGDGGGGSSSGNGPWPYPGMNRKWVAANSVQDYAFNTDTSHPWGARPVFNRGAYDYQGAAGVVAAISNAQPSCMLPNVKAVFAQQIYSTSGPAWKQLDHEINSTYQHTPATYGQLLNMYKARGGADPGVISQMEAVSAQAVPRKMVICITTDNTTRWEEFPQYTPVTEEESITCVYSREVTVTPQINAVEPTTGDIYDPIGKDNLHIQSSGPLKTAYGNLIDVYAAGTSLDPAEVIENLQAACDLDDGSSRPRVDLDGPNQEGMAEGGVLNITERERDATFSASQTYSEFDSCIAREFTSDDGGATWTLTGNTKECTGDYPPTKDYSGVDVEALVSTTPKVSGFWQMISVRCNLEGFEALVDATDGIQVANTGGDPYLASAAYSKRYDTIPSKLDFGDPTNPNEAKAATGKLGFYDKECGFECVASPDHPSATHGNGGIFNVGNQEAVPGGTVNDDFYGAVSGDHNNNEFTYFRDNQPRPLKIDVAFPRSSGRITYDGSAPLTTTVLRWAEGTPSIDGSDGGQFTMKTNDGDVVFDPDGGDVRLQKSWDPIPGVTSDSDIVYSNSTVAVLKGLHRDFTVQSTWASEPKYPQVLNFKWEYNVQGNTRMMVRGLGMAAPGAVGHGRAGVAETISAEIQGKCHAFFGPAPVDTELPFTRGTGTDTPKDDYIDRGLIEGPESDRSTVSLKFVRSTSE